MVSSKYHMHIWFTSLRPLNNEAFIRSVLIGVVDDCRATMVNTSRVAGTRHMAPNLNRLSG